MSEAGPSSEKPILTKAPWTYKSHVRESGDNAIYSISICPFLGTSRTVFAVTSKTSVSIYECLPNGKIHLESSFGDDEDDFWSCTWTFNCENRHVLVAAAGSRGVIRLIDTYEKAITSSLQGHSASINELRTHPKIPHIVLSAGADLSLRLWNVRTGLCIAVFAGADGHRDQVLSADFHDAAHMIVSGGMDHSIKIWRLDKSVRDAIFFSDINNERQRKERFKTVNVSCPNFSTRDIHSNYVDCVRWLANFVLSKSCQDSIICWKPGALTDDLDDFIPKDTSKEPASATTVIRPFELFDSKIWFMRFCTDGEYLVLGNELGVIYVWHIAVREIMQVVPAQLSHSKSKFTIRQTAISTDGSILLAVGDKGRIWRWQKQ